MNEQLSAIFKYPESACECVPIQGFVEYKRREYCSDIECPVQMIMNKKAQDSAEYNELREICTKNCLHTTYEFHHWLINKGYLLVRPEKKVTGGN